MARNTLVALGAIVAVGLILLMSSVYTVDQTQQALILQFGEPIPGERRPGLHFKLPLVQNVVYIERRVLDYDAPSEEVILGDQKRLVVDAFARYRITDPLEFYKTVGTETVLRARIDSILDSSMRKVLGATPLFTVLSADRADLMNQIRVTANRETRQYGIDVVDVRIKRADLPQENSEAIYRRMQTEREREAKELRAQGYELGQRIRAAADRERRVIIAEARKKSQIIRGRGDAESVRIFAEAFGQDIDFFTFYRSMEAYRGALGDDNTSFVLSPRGEFFRYFEGADRGDAPREANSAPDDQRNRQQSGTSLQPRDGSDQALGDVADEPVRIQ